MGHSTRLSAVILALLALAPTLGGCKLRKRPPPPQPAAAKPAELSTHFSASELAAVCDGKGGNTRAAAYAKTAGKTSPAAFFVKPEDSKSFASASMLSRGSSSTKPDTQGWESSTGEETQLVVCTEIVSSHKIGRHCTYDSTTKSGERVISELASANVRYEVIEAKTGAKVGGGTVELQAPNGCEAYVRYPQSIVTGDLTPVYEMALAPLEPADAAPPKLTSNDAWMACEGKPLVGAPPLSREPGAINKVYALEQTDDTQRWSRSQHQAFGRVEDHVAIDALENELPAIVVCETHTREPKKIRDCTYSSGRKVALHPATWSFRVVEAATGNVLAEKTLPARGGDCPWQWDFDDGTDADATASYAAQDKLVMPLAKPAPQKQPKRSARR